MKLTRLMASITTASMLAVSAMAETRVVVIPLGGDDQSPAYTDNRDGTVTDNATNLIWEKAPDGISSDWTGALVKCEGLILGGHSDWRVPSKEMLKSLVRCSEGPHTPLIDGSSCNLGSNVPTVNEIFEMGWQMFWTSSWYGDVNGSIAGIRFDSGLVFEIGQDSTYGQTKCVRIGY